MHLHLVTQRLIIRPLKVEDKAFILELLNTAGWLRFIGDRKVKDEAAAEQYIQNILDKKNFYYNVFESKESRKAIGVITFLYRETQAFPDIGFAMLPEFEGKGFAYEASKKYLDEIIKNKIVDEVLAITLPENTKSIKLIERLGLKYKKQFQDKGEVLNLYSTFIRKLP